MTYLIDDFSIERINFHKHLEMIYDKKLTFNMHVDQIITKAFNKFYNIKLAKFTYILPILKFSNLCYIPTWAQENALEKVQRMITKSYKD